MAESKTVAEWMLVRNVDVHILAESAGLDPKVAQAITERRYTASPKQRERLARALGVAPESVQWANNGQVENMYGHGPQFGRSP